MRLIDADELYKKLENKYKCANGGLLRFAYKDAIDDVCNAPTIDPVKHGRWIIEECIGTTRRHIRYHVCRCSECKRENGRRRSLYCPNCGAKMDGGEKE